MGFARVLGVLGVLDKSSHNFWGRHTGKTAHVDGFRYVHVVFVPDCAGVLVSWTVPDSFIDNFFARHTAFRHTNGFRYVHVDVCAQ